MHHNIFENSEDASRQRKEVIANEASIKKRLMELTAQVQFCVNYMDEQGLLDDHCFTFPDGETVHAAKTLGGG